MVLAKAPAAAPHRPGFWSGHRRTKRSPERLPRLSRRDSPGLELGTHISGGLGTLDSFTGKGKQPERSVIVGGDRPFRHISYSSKKCELRERGSNCGQDGHGIECFTGHALS